MTGVIDIAATVEGITALAEAGLLTVELDEPVADAAPLHAISTPAVPTRIVEHLERTTGYTADQPYRLVITDGQQPS